MDSGKPTCFLSFPEDPPSVAAAHALRADLEERGVTVLPPVPDDVTGSSLNRPFYWLRQADAVVHELEHLADIWRVALYWDRVAPTTMWSVDLPFHPADRFSQGVTLR